MTPPPRLRRYSPQCSLRSPEGETNPLPIPGPTVSPPLSEANLGEVDRPKEETEGAKPFSVVRPPLSVYDPPNRLRRYSPDAQLGGETRPWRRAIMIPWRSGTATASNSGSEATMRLKSSVP